MMVQLFQILTGHEDQCERGHSHSSMRAAIESALSADADLDCTEITVTMIGPYAVLEGFSHSAGDIVRAMMIAADTPEHGKAAYQLADTFAEQSRLRTERLLDGLWHNTDAADERLSERVLDGAYEWLEDGILDRSEGTGPWITEAVPADASENVARRVIRSQ